MWRTGTYSSPLGPHSFQLITEECTSERSGPAKCNVQYWSGPVLIVLWLKREFDPPATFPSHHHCWSESALISRIICLHLFYCECSTDMFSHSSMLPYGWWIIHLTHLHASASVLTLFLFPFLPCHPSYTSSQPSGEMSSSDEESLSERSCVSERSFRSERSGGSLSPCAHSTAGPKGDTLPWNLSKHERRKRKSQDSVLDPAERAVVRVGGKTFDCDTEKCVFRKSSLGIVHAKIKKQSLTSPHVVPKLTLFLLKDTKVEFFDWKRMFQLFLLMSKGSKTTKDHIDLHYMDRKH